jgi:hypothetical protein
VLGWSSPRTFRWIVRAFSYSGKALAGSPSTTRQKARLLQLVAVSGWTSPSAFRRIAKASTTFANASLRWPRWNSLTPSRFTLRARVT